MLEPKSQEIPFRFGLDLTEDEEGSPNGALELTNYDFNKEGALVRRNGFTVLTGTSAGPAASATSDFRGLVSNGETLGIVARGAVIPVVASGASTQGPAQLDHDSFGTYWNGQRTQSVDACTLTASNGNKYLCVVATTLKEASGEELSGTPTYEVLAKVIDLASRSVVLDTLVSTSAYGARVAPFTGTGTERFGIFYHTVASQAYKFISIDANTLTLGSPVTIASTTDAVANKIPSDMTYDGNFGYTATIESSGLVVRKVDPTGTISATRTVAAVGTGAVAILLQTNGTTLCVVTDSGSNYIAYRFPTALSSQTSGPITIVSSTSSRAVALGEETANNTILVFNDRTAGGLLIYAYDIGGGTSTLRSTSPNAGLMGKPWRHAYGGGSTQVYVPVAPQNGITSSYLTILIAAVPVTVSALQMVGQVAFDEAGLTGTNYLNSALLARLVLDPSDSTAARYIFPSLADLEGGDANTLNIDKFVRRVRVSRLSFSVPNIVSAVGLAGVVHIASSLPQTWDGSSLGAMTFADAPEAPTLTSPNAGVLTGTYSYKVVYEVSDEHGNLQVSPPGTAVSTTVSGKKITVTHNVSPLAYRVLPSLRNLRVKIYRTAAGGSTYNLAHTYISTYGSVVTVDDNVTDSALASAEELYATGAAGSALESEPAPPMRHMIAHRNRLFGIRSDTPQQVAFTQETSDPIYPRWHAVLTTRVDNDGGPPTALASIYDKVLVFQADQVCAFYGQGPDGAGSGAFASPEVVARGVGVSDADRGSVVTTPLGVFFKHRAGIHLIGPDFQVAPIGRAVADEVGTDTCVRARFLPSRHQVWFLFQDPTTLTTRQKILIYDTRFQRWVKWTSAIAAFEDVLEHAGVVYAVTRTDLYKLDTTTCRDSGGTPLFSQVIGTPWYRGPDRAQELRLWKVHLAGRKVAGAQNDANVVLEVFTQDERKPKSSTTADSTLTWAGSTVTALASNFLLSTRAVSQRCRAFRCRLTVTPQTTSATSTWLTLGALVYDFGALMGRGKQPSGNRPTIS